MNFLEYNHKFADGPDSKEYMVLDDTITLENPYLQEIIMNTITVINIGALIMILLIVRPING
jgi:hypothetical protein